MRILLAEDDDLLGDGVRAGLRQQDYTVDWVQAGDDALLAVELHDYDLVVLDLGLPVLDGLTVLRRLRAAGGDVPVLILTARDAVEDRVAGLDAGADDYLLKPFDLDELLARVRALRRRNAGRATPVLHHGELAIDPAAHRVTLGGAPVELSPREFTILLDLVEHAGRVRTRAQLEAALYGWDDTLASNAVEVHIHRLRRKLGAAAIRTVRGVGYVVPAATEGAP